MPTNHTSSYNLSQWVKTDQVKMEDFNSDNAKIDGALSTLAGQVAAKASQAALEAEITARTAAVSSINTALTKRGNCRVEVFSYTGTGQYPKTFTFSGTPVFFIVAGQDGVIFSGGPGGSASTIFNMDGRAANQSLQTSWSGRKVTISGDERGSVNRLNVVYQGVAFFAQDA